MIRATLLFAAISGIALAQRYHVEYLHDKCEENIEYRRENPITCELVSHKFYE